ncbi:MAG: flagellar motor switch protein FliG [candidate division Zixibacteria bacterium HGW-Zixibacteria-1]|nr:MAG: flagellar motor switch protein FliG [candidate division Zixibacteria bacterium HGW-Zixibacteria-1]
MKYEELNSLQKAAIALVAFGTEVAALVLRGLSDSEVEKVTIEIANLGDVPSDIEEKVIDECYQIFMARQYISQGGIDFAKEILEKAVGAKKAQEILARLESSFRTSGFNLLKNIDARQLVSFLQNEHPQTIALILSQLTSHQAAGVLSELPPELQSEVALRIATMEKISPEVLKEIESTLEGHFDTSHSGDLSVSGGAKTMAEILNLIESSAEKNILQSIEADDSDLASEIKNMMFVFDDLVLLDDRSIQRLLKEVETKDLSIALKAASEEVRSKIYSNVSERVAVMIKEEMEFMGPMRLSDVEAAQQRIVEAIRHLEEEGQVIISGRGGKEDVIV